MAHLLNDPAQFAQQALEGFLTVHADTVVGVDGGVAVRSPSPQRRVALVTGGGSGHYPAFTGLVGRGMADAAVAGNVFASPSSDAVAAVARAVAPPGGVLFCFGNYAGDVLQFGAAARDLNTSGIPTATVLVTDDIASAPSERRMDRRGIAGDLFVLKMLGAAADRGMHLDELAALGLRANTATFSTGVAFGGCTLPGHDAPLFEVATGTMALGLGIHGEPGLREADLVTADDLATLMVGDILAEQPRPEGCRVAVIVNGLGSVKSEELFVFYSAVQRRLDDEGLIVVAPEVGEFVTSFEMAGVSLSVCWVDDELESLWLAPADAPGYRRRQRQPVGAGPIQRAPSASDIAISVASKTSQAAAASVVRILGAVSARLDDDSAMLGQLDAVAGDGDHGIGMRTGAAAAWAKARQLQLHGAGAGTVLAAAAAAWNRSAGGTSGALWAALLAAVADALGDRDRPTAEAVADGVQRGLDEVLAIGKVGVGDKTLVDALVPFVQQLRAGVQAGSGLAAAWIQAASAARDAAERTAEMSARAGRARTHGDASRGTADPGAVSLGIVATVVGAELAKTETGEQ